MRNLLRSVLAAAALTSAAVLAQVPPAEPPQSDIDKIGDTMENIGTKPLKDLNLIKPQIDEGLERIMATPYSLTGIKTCRQFQAAVGRLTYVLGPDVDSPAFAKSAKTPAEQALSLGESAAAGIIPFSGVIRRLTGAEARQNYAKAAIYAGSVRRAYLKGTARQKGCKI